jgi:pimeloyl-ACP methyl ester carboxylesterase
LTSSPERSAAASRRRALKTYAAGLSAGVLALGRGAVAQVQPARRRTYVLVHGAWHGAWCWQRVSAMLEAQGHKVYTPTLTGLADRSHLIDFPITLDTHVTDIVNLFEWEDISSAILVGHSYGGWPVSGALEKIADRVSSMIFLDAFLPKNGQSGLDIQTSASQLSVKEAVARGEKSRPPPPVETFVFKRPEDADWVRRKMTPQPIGVSIQPIVLTGVRDRLPDKTYIRALHYHNPVFDQHLADCKADPSWKTATLQSGHDAMIDVPEQLGPMLLNYA